MFLLSSTLIAKEEIGHMRFRRTEVLNSEESRAQRYIDLQNAALLGNTYHTKVKIVFGTEEGFNHVETTVWYATDSFILLKGGISIPVKCIFDVKF